MKIACIHQPDFAPHLAFFERLLKADCFVILDNVQFIRRGWQHRDKIKTAKGSEWLTISLKKGDFHQIISDVILDENSVWQKKFLNKIINNYQRAPYFNILYPRIEDIILSNYTKLIEINYELFKLATELLHIEIPVYYASNFSTSNDKNKRLIELVNSLDCSDYITGLGSKNYLNIEEFKKNGIDVHWHEFNHPIYPQQFGEFIPGLSWIDLFFNCGPKSRAYLERN